MLKPSSIFRKRRKYVTIAAGFRCADGYVMCADTEETGFAFKRRVPKLEIRPEAPARADKCRVIFTGAGSASFVDALIEEMWNGAQQAESATIDAVSAKIKTAMLSYYYRIWGIYPKQTEKRQLPQAELMFAVWTPKGSGLYLARGLDINPVKTYATVGVGDELSNYICDRLYKSEMVTRHVLFLALHMLQEAKDHVSGCGGESHIAILQGDGTITAMPPIGTFMVANHIANLEEAIRQIALASADLELPDKTFAQLLNMFKDTLTTMRAQYRTNQSEFWNEIEKAQRTVGRLLRKHNLEKLTPSTSRKSKGRR